MPKVPQIDIDAIFERNAGHKPNEPLTYNLREGKQHGYTMNKRPHSADTEEEDDDADAEAADTY